MKTLNKTINSDRIGGLTCVRMTISLIAILLLGSCEKYLDKKIMNSQAFIETVNDCQLVLDNYGTMNTAYPNDGENSADDYYITTNYNLIKSNSLEDAGIYTWNSTVIRNSASPQWQSPYFKIYNANLVLEALDKIKDADQQTINTLKGSALFFRAFSLWTVTQLYTKPYAGSTAATDPGVPIRNASDINELSSRGTVQQTYVKILQDLQDAVNLLPNTSIVASRPNKTAAYAMLARTYLSMEDYANALGSANSALQIKSNSPNNGLLDYNTLTAAQMASNTPFGRFNVEVIFHAVMEGSSLLNGGSQFFNYCKVNLDVVNSYASNDLRSKVFLKPVSGGGYFFTGNYEPSTGGNLFNGLATDELYLIRAECNARAGNTAPAMDDLNTLLRARWTTGTYTDVVASSPDDALAKILVERRKELLFRGLRWTDLRRLNRDPRFKRELSRIAGNDDPTVYTLPANDPRYTLFIPQEVINKSGMAQNIR